jgi:hypothetical protein
MGIYSNGSIYGIRIYKINDDDSSSTLFEKKCDVVMSDDQKKEAYLFYSALENKNVSFLLYTECSTTYDIHVLTSYMTWIPMSLNLFLKYFGI